MNASPAFLGYLKPARDKFYREKDLQGALALVQPYLWKRGISEAERRASVELAGLILRSQGKYEEALKLYREIDDDYQAGYCEMLLGNIQGAGKHWSKLVPKRNNHWCVTLYGLVIGNVTSYPTIFQVRNHIESDIGNLIQANQIQMLENLLNYGEFLTQVNLETYKFLGRALFNCGWVDRAGSYLMMGQKTLPNDPEIYYHLGQYAHALGQFSDARTVLKQCLLIAPTYYPAKLLLEEMTEAS